MAVEFSEQATVHVEHGTYIDLRSVVVDHQVADLRLFISGRVRAEFSTDPRSPDSCSHSLTLMSWPSILRLQFDDQTLDALRKALCATHEPAAE